MSLKEPFLLAGFEIKTKRQDWLQEVEQPEKAQILRFCDHWYVVAEDGVVREDEVPDGWGWLTVEMRGWSTPRTSYRLVERIAAGLLDTEPLDRSIVAGILKQALPALS